MVLIFRPTGLLGERLGGRHEARLFASPAFKRLMAAWRGSLVLALMIGPQEGTQEDYGYAFRQAVSPAAHLRVPRHRRPHLRLITYWPVCAVLQPAGALALCIGVVTVIAAHVLLRWDDPVGNAKFGAVSSAVGNTAGISPMPALLRLVALDDVGVVAVVAAIRRGPSHPAACLDRRGACRRRRRHRVRRPPAGHRVFARDRPLLRCVHRTVRAISLMAVACGAAATRMNKWPTRASVDAALAWRPGLPLVAVGAVATIIAMTTAAGFRRSAQRHLSRPTMTFQRIWPVRGARSTCLARLGAAWPSSAVAALAATYLRHRVGAWVAASLGLVAVVLTVITLYDISKIRADNHVDAAIGPWHNLGSGGWLACMGFGLMAAGGFIAATAVRTSTDSAATPAETAFVPSIPRADARRRHRLLRPLGRPRRPPHADRRPGPMARERVHHRPRREGPSSRAARLTPVS